MIMMTSSDDNNSNNSNNTSSATGTTSQGTVNQDRFTLPTFRPNREGPVEVNVTELVVDESSANALRREDPFLYHSVFAPTNNLSRGVMAAASDTRSSRRNDSGDVTVTISRRTSVSTEVDAVTAIAQMLENDSAENDSILAEQDNEEETTERDAGIGTDNDRLAKQ